MIVLQILAGIAAYFVLALIVACGIGAFDKEAGNTFARAWGQATAGLLVIAITCAALVGVVFLGHFAFTGEWSFQ